jgi:hypothetical protein
MKDRERGGQEKEGKLPRPPLLILKFAKVVPVSLRFVGVSTMKKGEEHGLDRREDEGGEDEFCPVRKGGLVSRVGKEVSERGTHGLPPTS